MTTATTIKVRARGELTLPKSLRTRLGIIEGGLVDVQEKNGGIFIAPVSRLDAQLQKSLQSALRDLATGNFHGPFSSSRQLRAYLKSKKK